MKLTKIKRKELKRGDMYCLVFDDSIGIGTTSRMFMAMQNGDRMMSPLDEVYRIDAPDYAHELSQFSWKLKELDDKVESVLSDKRLERIFAGIDFGADGTPCITYTKVCDAKDFFKSDLDKRDNRIEELQYINQTLSAQLETLRMKIFDIEGREDLVTTELEHQIKEKDWRLGKQRSYIKGLVNDKTVLQDTVQKMTDDKRKMLSELKECHLLDIGDWQTRVDKLLAEIKGLEDENRDLIKAISKNDGDAKTKDLQKTVHNLHHCIDCIVDEKRVTDDGFRDTIAQRNRLRYQLAEAESKLKSDEVNLELLDDIMKIVNPIIKSGEYARPAQSGAVLAQRMWDVCHTMIDFRRKHNIVG